MTAGGDEVREVTRIAAGSGASRDHDPVAATAAAVARARDGLDGRIPDVAAVFVGAAHAGDVAVVGDVVRSGSGARHLVGATVGGVVAGAREHEDPHSVAVWLACLPGADIAPLRYAPPLDGPPAPRGAPAPGGAPAPDGPPAPDGAPAPEAAGPALEDDGWRPPPADASGVVLLADPRSFPADGYCAWLAHTRPGLALSGGLATGPDPRAGARLLLDDAVHDGGAVGLAIGGAVAVRTLVSQGCRPVGDPYVVTRAERNVILELAGRSPVERLRDLYRAASEEDRLLLQAGLHIGIVIDEYREDPGAGDFLVRAVLGAQRDGGGIAVGDVVRVGQTVRFHVRDAASADADLRTLLGGYADEPRPQAALLFTCNGRGSRLFDVPDHDARAVRAALGDLGVAGCFCAGELGPVGGRSFLHGFTVSLAGFVPA